MKKLLAVLTAVFMLCSAAFAQAEGADPVAAYEGAWEADGVTLYVYRADGGASVSVTMVRSGTEVSEWTYESAFYDEVADELNTLETGVRTDTVFAAGGAENGSSATVYTDGAAAFRLADGDTLVWVDHKEAPGTGIALKRVQSDDSERALYLHAAEQPEVPSPDWVTALPQAQDESVTQLFVVACMGMDKTTATVSMHERAADGGWRQVLSTPGFVGRNGLCRDEDHAEGCGQTPLGVYRFNAAFGIAPDPGCAMEYVQVDGDTYWSGDPDVHYNEMVDIRDCPGLKLDDSEHIVDYEYEYQYCLNISFNEDGTPGRGSAIFLHCFGLKKPKTGGCVAIPEYAMLQVMQRVRGDCAVVIDTFENLGASF